MRVMSTAFLLVCVPLAVARTSVPAKAEKWQRTSEGQGILEGIRQLSRDWRGRQQLRSRLLRRGMRTLCPKQLSWIKFPAAGVAAGTKQPGEFLSGISGQGQ